MLDDQDGAMNAYSDALKNNPSCVTALNAIANILKDRDQYGPAIEYYRQSTKFEENNGEVWANLGKPKVNFVCLETG
jgi:general transcriptional corepressor CYC8